MASQGVRVPRLIAGVDLTKLPLSPLEGFVLSRVDGMAPMSVLADLTNLDEADVAQIIGRLIELGAVEWARESVSLPRATGRVAPRTPSRPFTVPDALRSMPAARVNVPRPIRAPSAPRGEMPGQAEGMYRGKPRDEERVDPSRRSVFPSSPQASHTGTRRPPGELEEVESLATADTVPPPAPEPLEFEPPDPPSPHDGAQYADRADGDPEPASSPSTVVASGASTVARSGASTAPREAPRPASVPPSRPASTPPREATTSRGSRPPSAPPSDGASAAEPAPEELDLDPSRRKRIDDLYMAIDLLDHYETLGVARDSQKSEIRAAYFRLSKVFHPDTMFRKRLGAYKAKMEAIFNRLTEAYEVLGKKRSRGEYDRYLGLQDRTRKLEGTLDQAAPMDAQRELGLAAAQLEAELAAGAARAPSASPESAPEQAASERASDQTSSEASASSVTPTPTSQREMSEAAKARARELMAKKLRSAARASEANRTPKVRADDTQSSEPPPEPAASVGRAQVLRNLAGSLKETASQTGGFDQAQRYFLNARRAEREGDLAEAARALRVAMAMAPEREDVRAEHARVSAELAASLATTYEEQALYETRHGKWGAAALSWAKVFEGRPDDARAARHAAEALVEAKGDLHRAKELAQTAADLAPADVNNLRALARVYIAAGLALNARRVLERAATLDPSDEMVENLLRDLKR